MLFSPSLPRTTTSAATRRTAITLEELVLAELAERQGVANRSEYRLVDAVLAGEGKRT